MVRTPASQAGKIGSIPFGGIMKEVIKILLFFFSTNSLETILVSNVKDKLDSRWYKIIELKKRNIKNIETKHRKIFSIKNNNIFEILAYSSHIEYYFEKTGGDN